MVRRPYVMGDRTVLGELGDGSCLQRRCDFARSRGMWGSVCDVPVRRVCGTLRKRRKGHEGGVQLAYHGGFMYAFELHCRTEESLFAGAVLGKAGGCVVSGEGLCDGADFEVVDDHQWCFGASFALGSGI